MYMYPAVAAALKLSWWQKAVFRLALGAVLKRLNKLGKGYFTRQLAFDVRRQIIAELLRRIEEAKTKTPNFEIDEQALQCAAWVLESDTLQGKVNREYLAPRQAPARDVRARWQPNS